MLYVLSFAAGAAAMGVGSYFWNKNNATIIAQLKVDLASAQSKIKGDITKITSKL